jgi:hypothetical protein
VPQFIDENPEMHHVVKLLPRRWTNEQKAKRFTISQELFDRSNADENSVKNIITDDETLLHSSTVRYRNKSSIVALGGKIDVETEKSTSKSMKCEGVVARFSFMGRASFAVTLCHAVRQSTDSLTGGHEAFEEGRAKEGD